MRLVNNDIDITHGFLIKKIIVFFGLRDTKISVFLVESYTIKTVIIRYYIT